MLSPCIGVWPSREASSQLHPCPILPALLLLLLFFPPLLCSGCPAVRTVLLFSLLSFSDPEFQTKFPSNHSLSLDPSLSVGGSPFLLFKVRCRKIKLNSSWCVSMWSGTWWSLQWGLECECWQERVFRRDALAVVKGATTAVDKRVTGGQMLVS